VRGVYQGLGDLTLQARQADVEASLQEASVASFPQVHFGVDGPVNGDPDLHFPSSPGIENLTSKRPSSLWEAPPPWLPVVWVLAVYGTFSSWVIVRSLKTVHIRFIRRGSCWIESLSKLILSVRNFDSF
jgi:hypothetical protein